MDLWPYLPEAGAAETLSYLTEVIKLRGAEQRIALRRFPRLTVTYTFLLDAMEFSSAKLLARKNDAGLTPMLLPLWSEGEIVQGGVAAADTVLSVSDHEFSLWGDEVVVWASPDQYAILPLASTEDTSLGSTVTLGAPVGFDAPFAMVIPLLTVRALRGFNISRGSINDNRITATFSVVDNREFGGEFAEDALYRGLPVLDFPYSQFGDVSEQIIQAAEFIDNGFGPVQVEATRTIQDFGQTIAFFGQSKPEKWWQREFVGYMNGRQRPFWLPTFNRDLIVTATSSGSTIRVFGQTDSAEYIGRDIRILLTNGTVYHARVTGIGGTVGDDYILNLDATVGSNVTATNSLVCFMSHVRSETDEFEWTFDSAGRSFIEINVVEVPEE